MALTDIELLQLELDTAWETFCDQNPQHHAEMLKDADPRYYTLLKLAYQHGYTDGAQSVIRSTKE